MKTIQDPGGKKLKGSGDHGEQLVKSSSGKEFLTLLKQK